MATINAPKDGITGHLITINTVHHKIHTGTVFSFTEVINLGVSGAQDYLITTPNSAVQPHFGFNAIGTGILTVQLYEDTDKAGSVAQTLVCRRRNDPSTPSTTLHKGTTGGTTDGTLLLTWKTGNSGISLNASMGTAEELVLDTNSKYILRFTSGTASQDISINLSWYEEFNRFIA